VLRPEQTPSQSKMRAALGSKHLQPSPHKITR
jgi:hypothetical protein